MTKNYSPEAIAQNFWVEYFRKLMGEVENRIDEKEGHEYIQAKRDLPENIAVGSLEDLMIDHEYLVKPCVEWDEVKTCLKGVGITEAALIEWLVFLLKPYPLEGVLSNPLLQLEKTAERVCREFNLKIKELSPIIKKLENLARRDKVYRDFAPLHETIEAFKFNVKVYRAIVKGKKDTDKKWAQTRGIDKNTEKVSPQKHKFWNVLIPPALRIVNRFCHNDNCETTCKKTHQKAIEKVAELLKILYPSIYKEDIQTIANRIKQKDGRDLA